LVTLE